MTNSSSTHRTAAGKPAPGNLTTVFIIAVVGILILGFVVGGAPVRLRCSRAEARGPVNCVKQKWVLGVIPLGEVQITDVRGAKVYVSQGGSGEYDSGPAYSVELLTATGPVRLNAVNTSDASPKEEAAQRINAFVRNKEARTLALTEPGLLSPGNLGCLGIWLVLSGAWYLIRKIWTGTSSR